MVMPEREKGSIALSSKDCSYIHLSVLQLARNLPLPEPAIRHRADSIFHQ
ncbi:hypothetical protein PGTDC60_1915 [Porphyromonas gingivalis TDC60]|uniref:Uncharacterized protein n=1 Tax=Porphyromonas gingivalis (strain ATCC 33277 / DSM 20709 / CIP 103683 / JCM 12257 / NCTC 11834 / 2561) TaxID=431947 RepID=B2RIZ5_PORG3|nr:hypothetical protein PGN_0821 [Porphyromonas gingivalis ATCC 33277]BAK26064.1 hypothetical protein PGTDC60_1915 [Porphyromonas gingivalis TDC60]